MEVELVELRVVLSSVGVPADQQNLPWVFSVNFFDENSAVVPVQLTRTNGDPVSDIVSVLVKSTCLYVFSERLPYLGVDTERPRNRVFG